jgi:UDP-N-acetylglucosamine--N-acetylmuramyl-(pentapeptide) pyrophosphoryl-undecaprenol N-acetylglucosamine transferase
MTGHIVNPVLRDGSRSAGAKGVGGDPPRHGGCLLLVAASGGHLMQLRELADRLPNFGKRLWVTFDGEQGRTLLAGEHVFFIPEITERDVVGVMRTLPQVRRLMSAERPIAAVVSTGSAIALAFLPYAAMRGISTHYIESAARTGVPSLTGRLLAAVPRVRLYRQYEHCAGGLWGFGGSVFDGFRAIEIEPRPIRRIVVTLGMTYGFKRLVERLIAVIPSREVDVLWQVGHTPTDGLGIRAQRFVPAPVLRKAIADADVVIAHAGCGSALSALKAGKCPVLVPRDPQCGEVVDNHQVELAEWLAGRKLAESRLPGMLEFADLRLAASRAVLRQLPLRAFKLTGWPDCTGDSL